MTNFDRIYVKQWNKENKASGYKLVSSLSNSFFRGWFLFSILLVIILLIVSTIWVIPFIKEAINLWNFYKI